MVCYQIRGALRKFIMKKKYYRIRTHFNLDSNILNINLPDGVIGVSPVFSNKKKALKFLKSEGLPSTLLEEITFCYIDKKTGLEI